MAGPTDQTRTPRAKARPRLLAALRGAGRLPCPRCGKPMTPDQRLHVGHPQDVADVGPIEQALRLEHAWCNQRAGDRRRGRRPPPTPIISSRTW